MLKNRFRLRSEKDFQRIYKKGKKFRGKYGMLIAMNADPKFFPTTPQFGYVVSKKLGNAVERNLLRRQLKDLSMRAFDIDEKAFEGYVFSYIAYEAASDFELLKSDTEGLFEEFMKYANK